MNDASVPRATVVPESMLAALREKLGDAQVLTAIEDILPYGFDGTAVIRERPAAVVFPRSTEEVAFVLKLAREHGRPAVTRGSRTGLSGGRVPVPGAVILCLV